MRVLMATRPFHGHLNPMVPIASALVRRGHAVQVASAESLRGPVESLGFEFVPAGLDPRDPLPRHADGSSQGSRDWGAVPIRAKAQDLLQAVGGLPPDVIVREQTDLGSLLAAETLGVPCAVLGPAMYIPPRSWRRLVGDDMDNVRAELGLPLDPFFERLMPWLYLDPAPAPYQVPAGRTVPVRHEIQPEPLGTGWPIPDWVAQLPRKSTVYASLGTVFNRRARVFSAIVQGLLDAGMVVVATTGPDGSAVELPSDSRLHVVPWIAQGVVLPRCAAVVSHGGFGTVMGALWHKLPQIIVPLGSDNETHARRCTDLGVAVRVAAREVTSAAIRDAVDYVLTDAALRRGARTLRRRMRAMPDAETSAGLVEQLADDCTAVRFCPRRFSRHPRTAVVVPVFGRPELTRALLDDVTREPWVDPVVVDNRGDHVPIHGERVLRPDHNLGWAGGCNYALERLQDKGYDAFVILNNDTRLSPRFFAGLWRAHRTTGAALVGPVYDGVWPHQHPRTIVHHRDYRARNSSRHVPFLDGTCLFLPAQTIREIGLLDAANFPAHGWGVDFDYAVRVRRSGGSVVVAELSYLHHDGAGTASVNGDAWRVGAWQELVAGMRRKYGIAWPRLLRDAPSTEVGSAGWSDDDPQPHRGVRLRPVITVGPPGSGTSLIHRAVNLLGVPPAPASAVDAAAKVETALARQLGIDGWYTPADTESLLNGPDVLEAMDEARCLDAAMSERPSLWHDTSGAVFVPFWVAARDLDPVALLVLGDPARVAATVVARTGCSPVAALALWERRLRLCVHNLVGLPVLVVKQQDLVDDPTAWATSVQAFLAGNSVPLLGPQNPENVLALAASEREGLQLVATVPVRAVSCAQWELYEVVASLIGVNQTFPEVLLPAETPSTERVLTATRTAPVGDPGGSQVPDGGLRTEWVRWLDNNRRAGVPDGDLLSVLVEHGVPLVRARRALALVERSPATRGNEPPHRRANRDAWDALAERGIEFSRPVTQEDVADARETLSGPVSVPWTQIRSVLCLAAGGGQQSALFASLGCTVVVADLSPAQLGLDTATAAAIGHRVECVETDMLDLSALAGRSFDLVYQPVSMCYVPDPAEVHRQVATVLRPGGWYWVEHWNPVRMQLAALGRDGPPYRLVRPQCSRRPVRFGYAAEELIAESGPEIAWHYIHPLSALIGSLGDAGLSIVDFAERRYGDPTADPGTEAHLVAYVPPLFTILARREQGTST